MTAVTLRAAETADVPAIAAVFLAARKAMTYLPVIHTDDTAARFFFGLVTEAHVQVAVRDEAVIGFAAVRAGWLEHLNVHPSAQSTGIGSRLIEWAKEISPTGLDLWVFQRNIRAQALYESHGWRVMAVTDGDNEEGQPDAHMRWEPPALSGR
jgi:ribosomal protein S18 acetylase RimI-like enzyme